MPYSITPATQFRRRVRVPALAIYARRDSRPPDISFRSGRVCARQACPSRGSSRAPLARRIARAPSEAVVVGVVRRHLRHHGEGCHGHRRAGAGAGSPHGAARVIDAPLPERTLLR